MLGCEEPEAVCRGEKTPFSVVDATITAERYEQLRLGFAYTGNQLYEDLGWREQCYWACAYFAVIEEDDSWDYMFFARHQGISAETCELDLEDDTGTVSCAGTLTTLEQPNDPC